MHINRWILENPLSPKLSQQPTRHDQLQPLVHPSPPQDAAAAPAGGAGGGRQHPPRGPGAQHDPARRFQAAEGPGRRAGGAAVRPAAARHAPHLVRRNHDPPRPRGARQPEPGARRAHRPQGRPLRPGRRGRHHGAGPHADAARGGDGQARAARPARVARDRDQRGADRSARAGQARHPGGAPFRRARQVAAALRSAGRGAGVRAGAPRPSSAGRERPSRCATWWAPAGSCRPRAACCATASS
ncbi:hypothetical protein QFZ47_001602 [Variovorax paradoxus]|nr:hypothetical protein [Variovorax paradoxus]